MPLIVETGTGDAASNSYVSETVFETYADDRGITLAAGDEDSALIRATVAMDSTYRNQFPGTRTNGRSQALEWPRIDATDAQGVSIDKAEIPIEIIQATCEMAIRELASPGSMMPDMDHGNAVKRLKAGSVEIEYGPNATPGTVFTIIDGILSSLIGSSSSGGQFQARAMRG